MSMRALEDLREMLCEELDEIAKKQEMNAGDLETVHKLTVTIKNIDKIYLLEEDGEHSQAGDWEADMRGTYGRGSSYANRGKHYVRGHYSRRDGDDYSHRRDGMGRYSRGDAKEHMITKLEEMERTASNEKEREAIRRCISQLENA